MKSIELDHCPAGHAPRFSLSAFEGVRWSVCLTFLLSFSSLLLFSSAFAAPQVAWTARYSFGTNSDSRVFALALDAQQNLLVVGTSRNDQGNADYVTAKYSPNGSNLWTQRFDSGGADTVRGLALDRDGNAVITGTSKTVKYGVDGAEQWAAPYGGRGVAVDSSNDVVVTGFSEDDFSTAKLTPQGSNVWTRTFDKIGRPDVSQAVKVDGQDNILVGGLVTFFRDRSGDYHRWWFFKFNPSGTKLWETNFGNNDIPNVGEVKGFQTDTDDSLLFCAREYGGTGRPFHAAKIAASGQIQWNRILQSTAFSDGATATGFDAVGNLHVTGNDSISYPEHFVYKTFKVANITGDTVWRTNYAGPGAGYHRANAIAIDTVGSVFVTGQSPSAPGQPSDWATIKYNSDGQEQWVMRYDGALHGEDQATAIAVDRTGAIYAGGFTTTTNGIEMLIIKYVEVQHIQVQPNQNVLLQFLGTPGASNRVQATTDFLGWLDIGFSVADTNGLIHFLDTNAPNHPFRFYRAVTP